VFVGVKATRARVKSFVGRRVSRESTSPRARAQYRDGEREDGEEEEEDSGVGKTTTATTPTAQ